MVVLCKLIYWLILILLSVRMAKVSLYLVYVSFINSINYYFAIFQRLIIIIKEKLDNFTIIYLNKLAINYHGFHFF